MKHVSAIRMSAALGLALAMAACSGGAPGEDDIRAAIKNNLQIRGYLEVMIGSMTEAARLQGQSVETITVDSYLDGAIIEVSGCEDAQGAPGQVCDFQLAFEREGEPTQSSPMTGRFYQADGIWQVADLRG